MVAEHPLVFARLVEAGIAVFLLISAFDIHKARRTPWREVDRGFGDLAGRVFEQPRQPLWLYAVGFPFVAVNFGAMVAMLMGHTTDVRWPFVGSIAGIVLVDLIGWKTVIYRDLWSDILTKIGYLIGGALVVFLFS